MDDTARALRAWAEHDDARAIHPADHAAVRATEAARALVLELATSGEGPRRDLFTACATLGRLLHEQGASPTMVSTTIDGAAAALSERALTGETLASARASLLEGYAGAIVSAERARARAAWEWPACAVVLDERTCAIAAGHPTDNEDAVAAWAGRVAARAERAGVRRVVVSGEGLARDELEAALRLVGIEVSPRLAEGETTSGPSGRSWLPRLWPRGGRK